MGLALYDSTQTLITAMPRLDQDANLGGPITTKFYVRNDDAALYYTNMAISYTGPIGTTLAGWTVKLISGDREPTQAEWDTAITLTSLTLSDIGASGAADTTTFYPFWMRVFVAGGSDAAITDSHQLQVIALPQVV